MKEIDETKIAEEDIREYVAGKVVLKDLAKKYGIQVLAMSKRIHKQYSTIKDEKLKRELGKKLKENDKRARKTIHISEEDLDNYAKGLSSIKDLAIKYHCNRNTMSNILRRIYENRPVTYDSQKSSKNNMETTGNGVTKKYSTIGVLKQDGQDAESKDEYMYKVAMLVVSGNLDIKDGMKALDIKDSETMKEICLDTLCQMEDKELAKQYLSNVERLRKDYSKLNFAALAIKMLKDNMSQSQLANLIGIEPRVVSREFAKLDELDDKDEEVRLCTIVKYYADLKMRRQKVTGNANEKLVKFLNGYEERHKDFLKPKKVSETEKIFEEKRKIYEQATEMLSDGVPQAAIAKKLGVTTSFLRRVLVKDARKARILNPHTNMENIVPEDRFTELNYKVANAEKRSTDDNKDNRDEAR